MSLQTQAHQILGHIRSAFLEDSERIMKIGFLGENKVFIDHSLCDS